jgi:hypothetical protein
MVYFKGEGSKMDKKEIMLKLAHLSEQLNLISKDLDKLYEIMSNKNLSNTEQEALNELL